MLLLVGIVVLFVQCVVSQNVEYDPPVPYIPPAVTYNGNFKVLHEELNYKLDGVVRDYYVAVEEVTWDYAGITPKVFQPGGKYAHAELEKGPSAIGSSYYKAVYREYTDDTYSEAKPVPQWQGLLGPILRAEVGDTLRIHFWNRARYNFSMHPHGVFYEFEMEGAVYKGASEVACVRPNETYTYTWQVSPRSGPGPLDGHSIAWGYHSHVTENDLYAGLFGAILVYRRGTLNEDTITNEIVTAFFAIDENLSPYLQQTIQDLAPQLDLENSPAEKEAFYASNVKHAVNGLMYAAPVDANVSVSHEKVWHVLSWGSDMDVTKISWESATVTLFDRQIAHVLLMPATFKTVKVQPTVQDTLKCGALGSEYGAKGMVMYYKSNP